MMLPGFLHFTGGKRHIAFPTRIPLQHSAVQCSKAQSSRTQCSAIKYGILVVCGTVQCSAVLCTSALQRALLQLSLQIHLFSIFCRAHVTLHSVQSSVSQLQKALCFTVVFSVVHCCTLLYRLQYCIVLQTTTVMFSAVNQSIANYMACLQ